MSPGVWISLIFLVIGLILIIAGWIWYAVSRRNNMPISFWAYLFLISGAFIMLISVLLISAYY